MKNDKHKIFKYKRIEHTISINKVDFKAKCTTRDKEECSIIMKGTSGIHNNYKNIWA